MDIGGLGYCMKIIMKNKKVCGMPYALSMDVIYITKYGVVL